MALPAILGETLKYLGVPAVAWGLNKLFGGGGGGGTSPEQEEYLGTQTDLAKLMLEIIKAQNQMTGPYMTETGQPGGPIVEALMMAMNQARQAQAQPRQRLVNQTPFNPYASAASATGPPIQNPTYNRS